MKRRVTSSYSLPRAVARGYVCEARLRAPGSLLIRYRDRGFREVFVEVIAEDRIVTGHFLLERREVFASLQLVTSANK